MNKRVLKRLEKGLKQLLRRLLLWFLPAPAPIPPKHKLPGKVLVFRLDQRVGNGVMLLPLLKAIRRSLPEGEIHLLIHHPVAELYRATTTGLVDRLWPYDQPRLLKRPWQFWGLLRSLKREHFDVVITAHNPDNFSLSQALLGRWIRPRCLVGFRWGENHRFYDLAVPSSPEKHYTDAMVDLWRPFDPPAKTELGGLHISAPLRRQALGHFREQIAGKTPLLPPEALAGVQKGENFPEETEGGLGILVWIGATGNKILPAEVWECLRDDLARQSDVPVFFAAGPQDGALLPQYPSWLQECTILWKEPLVLTAALFSAFDLFISGDTGPMHLAVAVGCPTLSIFVGSRIQQYGYHDGKRHLALWWDGSAEARKNVQKALKRLLADRERPTVKR